MAGEETSSAKPAHLLGYESDGLAQVAAWEAEAGNLEEALSNLRSALAGRDLPDDCHVSVLFYETWFGSLTADQRHLDEWVGDVGRRFVEASGWGLDAFTSVGNPDLTMTVADSEIAVGFADRERSERRARLDAAALDEVFGGTGLLHPYDLGNNPEVLDELAGRYPEVRDALARTARFATDETYAATLVNTLGAGDVRTMADLAATFGIAQDRGLIDGDAYAGYVVPLATLLGTADRSGAMSEAVRDAIFDMDATDEEPVEGTDPDDIVESQLADMRYRSLALLAYAGDFSPRTTAEMADAVISEGPPSPDISRDYTGFTDPVLLADRRPLAANQWAVLDALARDDQAANIFYRLDDHANLALMSAAPGAETAAGRLGVPAGDVAAEIEQRIADTFRGGLLENPLATGTTYGAETTELVAAMIETAGWEHTDASDPARQAMAQVTTPYTRDIAALAAGESILADSRLPHLDRVGIGNFMEEVSESEAGRMVLAQNAAALVRDEIDGQAAWIVHGDPAAFGEGEQLAIAYYRELGQAWEAVQIGWLEQREAQIAAWRTLSDPVVELVSGGFIEHIPVVGTAADLPGAKQAVEGMTGAIGDRINSALYDNLIPRPEIESMTHWREAIGGEVSNAIAMTVYENPEIRDHLLRASQVYEAAAWETVNSDGVVTFEEFTGLEHVRNVVATFSGEVTDGIESQIAFRRPDEN